MQVNINQRQLAILYYIVKIYERINVLMLVF